ncbi:MAG: putative transport system permease protein, partial [Thermoleophilaceae bacterium]|nr:putative transport system permease protein [Thermoleophilaceae bacterium]
VRVLVLAAAVSLLGSMLVFISHSLSTMTGTAVRSIPVDWQGPVASEQAATAIAAKVAAERGVLQASPSATAPFDGAVHNSPAGTARSSSGSILAVPPDYANHFNTIRFLQGGLANGQVVLDQQLAATLQARVGDTISVRPTAGAKPKPFKVSGVAVVTAGDVLFQPLNPVAGPAPAQPPAEVIVMPFSTFASQFGGAYGTSGTVSPLTNAVPGAQTGVQWQVQAQVDPSSLTGSPSAALKQATGIRNRVERDLTGKVQFVDNLESGLTGAAGDALWAETLYIMLAVPGALIALGLAYLAALGTAERDRRELALLRARGATRRNLFTLAGVESVLLGIISGLLGAALAVATVSWLVGRSGLTTAVVAVVVAICIILAVGGALAARLAAISDVLRASISEARQSVRRSRKPLWQRLYLDVLALAVSGLIYWLTASTGFSAVVNPDSNPTLSLSVYMFFAPALLWIGATLLMVRLRGGLLAWTGSRLGGSRATTLRGFVLASAGRRGAAINRGLVVAGLLLAFGVNLGLFTATYDHQAAVDAQLTLGADLAVTAPRAGAAPKLAPTVSAVRGVTATTALDHAYAYVGPDLQDTYGIDASTFTRATTLRDSYFLGGSAQQMIDRLKTTSDGILVSRETITDYQLNVGDLLRLRVLDHSTGKFRVAPFHVVGVVQEFPSAPKDSFMVTNLSYLEQVTNGPGPNVIFAKTSSDPSAVAKRVGAAVVPLGGSVKNIKDQVQQTTSSITTVDLSGISRIEQAFSLILAAGAMSLFVALAIGERRQEFATMAALGASVREISAFLWSEVVMVLGAALILAGGLGWLLSLMLVAMLKHVFDPPPDQLSVPWMFLRGLGLSAILAAAVAATLTIRMIGRLPLGAILREE